MTQVTIKTLEVGVVYARSLDDLLAGQPDVNERALYSLT